MGCSPHGAAPQLDALADQTAKVGVELALEVRATDADGDRLTYSFQSNVPTIRERAQMTRRPDGSGLFRWTPRADDVNPDGWLFDFTASDGARSDTVTIRIVVKSEIGQAGAPVFREPLGSGTTLDLSVQSCLEVRIVVDDPDSPTVVLAEEEPRIEGAVLVPAADGLSGRWRWCPTAQQSADDDRYTLTLSADDRSGGRTLKRYLIVLRKPPKPGCPGAPPDIRHTPSDQRTVVGLTITAMVTDDRGLKGEPMLYYASVDPGDAPDLGAMTQVTMVLLDGDTQSGTWGADVPNPVAREPAGASAQVYYVLVASDNDDVDGDCDHLTETPAVGAYAMTVTNPGGVGGAGVCEPCTADVQCGGVDDLCVRVGPMAEPSCLRACAGPADCPVDTICSAGRVSSVDGGSARQCVPVSGDCADPGGGVCVDDRFEDNDSRAQAAAAAALAPGVYDVVSCEAGPFSDDEDFWRIELSGDSQIEVTVDGTDASDLDLAVQDATGAVVGASASLVSHESVALCLGAGTYYIRVHAYSPARNPYTLTYVATSTRCAGATCSDDANEDDDDRVHARAADIYPTAYVSTTNAICPGDDDWFAIELFDGETVDVDLTFEQTSSLEDLDLHLYDASGVDLTPCSEAAPFTCSDAQGQSATSNEHLQYTVADLSCAGSVCSFYVVVHGWDGSANLYDIRIALTP